MRTTLNIDHDVLNIAKSLAYDRKISVGDALSELARKGIDAPIPFKLDPDTGLPTFDVPVSAPSRITPDDIKRLEEEDDLERYRRSLRLGSKPAKPESSRRGPQPRKVNETL